MMRIAVCDDEPVFQKKLSDMIGTILDEDGIGYEIKCYDSGKSLISENEEKMGVDVIFLDVNMKELDGLETAKIIRGQYPKVYIVFVTAFITYALEGYKVNAIRYLLKNDENFESSLKECMEALIDKMDCRNERCIFEFQSGRMEMHLERILYIESRLHRIIFFVMEQGAGFGRSSGAAIKEYYMYEKLDNIQKMLGNKGFCRIHQSFLVNMAHVKSLERYEAVLSGGLKVSISKKYYKEAESEYIRLKGEL